ncbi:MAG: amidohydrolase family protein [Phycisphaerae bacterium]
MAAIALDLGVVENAADPSLTVGARLGEFFFNELLNSGPVSMSMILKNALLVDLDPPRVEAAELRLDGGRIAARGAAVAPQVGDDVINCGGAVVLPGLVNGHTHLYSALAVGIPPPPRMPRNFHEVLKYIWWRLDQALDAAAIEHSGRIGALEALRCGTTTLIDHHASPNCIPGSLDLLQNGIAEVGLRGVLCYEVTDRHGPDGRKAGIEENRRYLQACAARRDGQFAALVGAHASFTLDDEALDQLAALAFEQRSGVHIHVAEDPCDEAHCREKHQIALIERFSRHNLLRPESVLAHGTHLDAAAVERVNAAGCTIAHNPRSNMNNAVGYAPIAAFRGPVMVGTDGIGADMFTEARAAWLIAQHQHAGLTPTRIVEMLAASARRASAALGVTVGKLEIGAAADVLVTDYVPFTPISFNNLPGHLLFGLAANHVRHVIIDGQWRLRDRAVVGRNEQDDRAAAAASAIELWERMAKLPLE